MNKQNIKFNSSTIALICIMTALAALIVVAIFALFPKAVPVPENTVTVTVDEPGVVLSLDPSYFSVQGAETVAEEDRHLIHNLASSLPFKQSSSMLLKALLEARVMHGDSSEAILLAVEAGSVKSFETVCSYFKEAMAETNCTAKLYTLHINEKLPAVSELAEKYDTTYAKALLCNKLSKELDMKAADLITKTISEILSISKDTTGDDEVVDNVVDNVNSDAAKDDESTSSEEESASSSDTSSASSSSSNDSSSNDSSSADTSSSNSSSTDSSSNDSSSSSSGGITFTPEPDDDGWYPRM